jgi:tetratricopeptide (TPR) repeat protein
MSGPIAAILLFSFAANAMPDDTPPKSSSGFAAVSRQAEQSRDANRLDEAVALYKEALLLKPDWDEGWWNLGSITYDKDNYSECAAAFERLAALKQDSVPAWTMSGLCEYRLRRYDAALGCLRRAEALGFQEPAELSRAARLHLALVLTKTKHFEAALVVLTELTLVHRKSPEIIAAAGIAGLREAWLPFEVPETRRDVVAKLGDAIASAMEQDVKEAIAKFEIAVRDYPAEANVHFRFGAFLTQQEPDRGITEIQKTLALDPEHVPALVGLATIYTKRDELPEALEYSKRAVKAGPEDFSTHLELGRVLLAMDRAKEAAPELENAVRLSPAGPEARFSLAAAYSRLGRKADAQREQEEFKRLTKFKAAGHQ